MEVKNNQNHESIGMLLLQSGKLKPEDADKILHEQTLSGLRFGDAAIKLGLLKKADIDDVLSKQFDFSYVNKSENAVNPMIVTAYHPFAKSVEQIRTLRGQLGVRWFTEHKSLVISSPKSQAGTSTICANLAVSFAQLGKKTLLVDANMRKPKIHKLFNIENKRGFSDILVSRAGTESIQPFPHFENLSILTAGAVPPNPVELLGRSELKILVAQLEALYDVIIYDSSAFLEHCDSQLLLTEVKGAVLTVKKNKTHIKNIQQVQKDLDVIHATLVGSVINDF